jgi:rsbT antagonist protein RsbS
VNTGPALVSILRQGDTLVASVNTALDDSEMLRFQADLVRQIGEHRARGVIIDVAALDVLDSFGSRTLRAIAEMARLRGATTVVVGIQPDVDQTVANHLVETVDASRLMGASVIITGLSPTIAQTLVTIGVDLSKMNTIGDLQGGLEEAERLLGYRVTRTGVSKGS